VGAYVDCHPKLDDLEVVEKKHRASCLLKLMPQCSTCPNSRFTLLFNTPDKKLLQVQCPRWKEVASLHIGKPPDEYVVTEEATCREAPFPFCGSCPSRAKLQELDIDKSKDGWLSRWDRFRKEMLNADG
jgi:hypothetical protein